MKISTLIILLCRPSRNSSCIAAMHKLETRTLSVFNAFYIEVVVTRCNALSLLLHPPTATLPPPLALIQTGLNPLTHFHQLVHMFLSDLLRLLPRGLFVCVLLRLADHQAACQQRVQPGSNKGWFSGRLVVLRHPLGKVIVGRHTDNSIIFREVTCCYPTGRVLSD